MRRLLHILICVALVALTGCRKGNDMVIGEEDMASLLADLHMAEAAVDLNYSKFPDDSTRLALRQSVYVAHGVTPEQVDSSIGWYGHHLEEYMKVYDRTIEILKDRQKDLLASSMEHIVMEGDSVNIWPLSSHFEFSQRSPSRMITFNIEPDSTWRDRDVFILKYYLFSAKDPVITRIAVLYADGSVAYNTGFSRDKGTADCNIRVDSLRKPQRIVGTIIATPRENETVRLDSISFVRMRNSLYRGYVPTRNFGFNVKPKPLKTDTVAADSAAVPASPNTLPGSAPHGNARPATPNASSSQPTSVSRTRGHRNASRPPSVDRTAGSGESAAQKAKRERDAMRNNVGKK